MKLGFRIGGKPKATRRRRTARERLEMESVRFLKELREQDPQRYRQVMEADLKRRGLLPHSPGGGAGGESGAAPLVEQIDDLAELIEATQRIGERINPPQPPQNAISLIAEVLRQLPSIVQTMAMLQSPPGGQMQVQPFSPPALTPPPSVESPATAVPSGQTQGPAPTGSVAPQLTPMEQLVAELLPLLALPPTEAAQRCAELIDERAEDNPGVGIVYQLANVPLAVALRFLAPYRAHHAFGPVIAGLDTEDGQKWFAAFRRAFQVIQERGEAEVEPEPPGLNGAS